MKITTAQLNATAALMNTTDKALVINAVLATLIESGMGVREGFGAVFGDGAFDTMAAEVHAALCAKAAA